MNAHLLGPPVLFAVFLCGIRIGWRLSRLKTGDIDVPTQGFSRGASKALRVSAGAIGAALVGGPIGFLAQQVDSTFLAYVAVAIVATCIGIVWGAMMQGWLRVWRTARR